MIFPAKKKESHIEMECTEWNGMHGLVHGMDNEGKRYGMEWNGINGLKMYHSKWNKSPFWYRSDVYSAAKVAP